MKVKFKPLTFKLQLPFINLSLSRIITKKECKCKRYTNKRNISKRNKKNYRNMLSTLLKKKISVGFL